MNEQEQRAVLTIALLAAFADGANHDRERAALQQVAGALGAAGGVDLPALYREVLIAKPDLTSLASQLSAPEQRLLAYEMAVAVCDADGERAADEHEFLGRLGSALGLTVAATQTVDARSGALAAAASIPASAERAETPNAQSATPASEASQGTVQGRTDVSSEELDQLIVRSSITNAALELLPDTLASMAIIPLQMRLVYRIGRAYGYPMDRSQAKDFVATLGVGVTSQYIEQFGRKLLGGLLGTVAGGIGRGIGRQAASSGLTFATTYALGRVAQRYYAAGRNLDSASLQATFASLLEEARGIAPRYGAQIEQTANAIDVRNLATLLRQV